MVERETPAHGDKTDPNFQYGTTQAYVALVILVGEASAFSIQIFFNQSVQAAWGWGICKKNIEDHYYKRNTYSRNTLFKKDF